MKYNNHNVRKIFVLALLNNSTPKTAKEITDLCSVSSMRTTLKRYCQQGLLKRKRENKKQNTPYKYEITEKGRERLFFLIGDTSIKSQMELLVREPIKKIATKPIEEILLIREKIRI